MDVTEEVTLSCCFFVFFYINHVCVCQNSSLHIKHLVVEVITMAFFVFSFFKEAAAEIPLRRRLAASCSTRSKKKQKNKSRRSGVQVLKLWIWSSLALKRWFKKRKTKPSFCDSPPRWPQLARWSPVSELLLPRGGAWIHLHIRADFVQLRDILSVKCHLFYKF